MRQLFWTSRLNPNLGMTIMKYDRHQCLWLVATVSISLVWLLSSPTDAQDAPKSQATQQSSDAFRLRYAQAYLKYAEVNLKLANAANARVRRTVSDARLREYREEVEVARGLLAIAESGDRGNDFPTFLKLAEAAYSIELDRYRRAKRANERAPTSTSQLDVARLRLRSELALINLEHGRSLANASSEKQTEWKMNLLYHEVLRLNEEVSQLRSR